MHDHYLPKHNFFVYAPTQQIIRVMSKRMQKCVVLDLELFHIVLGFLIVVLKMFPNQCSYKGILESSDGHENTNINLLHSVVAPSSFDS
jgi:hypothetical protein